MPDPLSIASGVAGLLSLTIQLSQILYEQIHTVKNAPKDAEELLAELKLLQQVLANLDAFLKTQAAKLHAFSQTSTLSNAIKGCGDKITAIKSRLEKLVYSKGLAKLIERGKWFYEHDEHKELIAALHRYLGLFQISLNADGIDLLSKSVGDVAQEIKSLKVLIAAVHTDPQDVERMTKRFDDILLLLPTISETTKDVAKILHQSQRWDEKWQDQESREIVDWLSPLNFWTKQDDVLSKKEEGTGGWIFEDPAFKDWVNGNERILWCPGMPGAGKTVLASVVIDHLRKTVEDERNGIAFVYCNYKEKENQTAVNLVASLVQQLLQRQPGVPSKVRSLYEQHSRKRTTPTLAEISELLRLELTARSRVFIIIDALDECDETCGTRRDFISYLLKLPINTSLMVTSREISSIKEELEQFKRLEIRARDLDVQMYLEGYIERENRLKRHVRADSTLKTTIIDKIVKKAEGMFLLAQLHIESLGKKQTRRAVYEALENLPKGLDATYDDAMARIYNQDDDDVLLAEKILCWLSYSLRPLTVQELQEAIAVKAGDRELNADDLCDEIIMASVCAGLVTIDEESNVFRLVHYTTQEYFERKRLEKFPMGRVTITKTCLAYLSLDAFKAGYANSDKEMLARLDRYPFLQHAAQYWGVYAARETESAVETEILEFLAQDKNLSCSFQAKDIPSYRYKSWSQQAPDRIPGLSAAAAFGLKKTVEALVARNIDVNIKDSRGEMALHLAAGGGYEGVVRALLEGGAAVDAPDRDSRTALHLVAGKGHEGAVRVLLEGGGAVETLDGADWTALHRAAEMGHEAAVRALLEGGAVVEAPDGAGWTALHRAAEGGHKGAVRVLLEGGATVEKPDLVGRTALHLAAGRGHEAAVRALLDGGAVIEAPDRDGRTALHLAAGRGHEGAIRALLEGGAAVEASDGAGWTALHLATEMGHEGVVRVLLEVGAVVEAPDRDGRTALHLAAGRGHEAAVRALLEGGAVVEASDQVGRTVLHLAARVGHEGAVRTLLEGGAAVETPDRVGRTALHLAAAGGHGGAVRVLLEGGAAVEKPDRVGRTALHLAATGGHGGAVRALLEGSAAVEKQDRDGRTALHLAAAGGDGGAVRVLLEGGAAVEKPDRVGRTALHLAAAGGHEGAVRVLLEGGAAVETPDGAGWTALHLAAARGHRGAVRALLEGSAAVEKPDPDGRTALHRAAEGGHSRVMRILIKHQISMKQC